MKLAFKEFYYSVSDDDVTLHPCSVPSYDVPKIVYKDLGEGYERKTRKATAAYCPVHTVPPVLGCNCGIRAFQDSKRVYELWQTPADLQIIVATIQLLGKTILEDDGSIRTERFMLWSILKPNNLNYDWGELDTSFYHAYRPVTFESPLAFVYDARDYALGG